MESLHFTTLKVSTVHRKPLYQSLTHLSTSVPICHLLISTLNLFLVLKQCPWGSTLLFCRCILPQCMLRWFLIKHPLISSQTQAIVFVLYKFLFIIFIMLTLSCPCQPARGLFIAKGCRSSKTISL